MAHSNVELFAQWNPARTNLGLSLIGKIGKRNGSFKRKEENENENVALATSRYLALLETGLPPLGLDWVVEVVRGARSCFFVQG